MDTTHQTFLERVVAIPPVILRYQLKPLSMGHTMLLRAANSKFINGDYNSFLDVNAIIDKIFTDGEHLIAEFMFAVLVCSTTYDEFKEEISNGQFLKALDETKQFLLLNKPDLLEEIQKFARYIHKGTQAPNAEPKTKNKSSGSDDAVSLEESMMSVLMGELGYTRDECLNLPLTETLSAYILYHYRMDQVVLIGPKILEAAKRLETGKF